MAIDKYSVSHPTSIISGHIKLEGSKSISNRVLLIRALCNEDFTVENLSPSDDTVVLNQALQNADSNTTIVGNFNMGHAGTSIRFLTAFLSMTDGQQNITGSERMLQRPIGPLVKALNDIGAQIIYTGKEGYPPLEINKFNGQKNKSVSINAAISSQFISALCLIAPRLPLGLEIKLEGKLVSRSYIEMTLSLMRYFGVDSKWDDSLISIAPQSYQAKPFTVEADWSAASYYYIIAALSKECNLSIAGLSLNSLQGDQAIHQIAPKIGVSSIFKNGLFYLTKSTDNLPALLENDFITHPDIAQSVATICAGIGISGLFTGLQTLAIKETDRTAALKTELKKLDVSFSKLPTQKFAQKSGKEYYMLQGKSQSDQPVSIATYKDHRMAMSFAPLGLLHDIIIENPDVVTKSYPNYWNDLKSLGFEIS